MDFRQISCCDAQTSFFRRGYGIGFSPYSIGDRLRKSINIDQMTRATIGGHVSHICDYGTQTKSNLLESGQVFKRVVTSMTAQVPMVSADASQTNVQPMGQAERSLLTVSG